MSRPIRVEWHWPNGDRGEVRFVDDALPTPLWRSYLWPIDGADWTAAFICDAFGTDEEERARKTAVKQLMRRRAMVRGMLLNERQRFKCELRRFARRVEARNENGRPPRG